MTKSSVLKWTGSVASAVILGVAVTGATLDGLGAPVSEVISLNHMFLCTCNSIGRREMIKQWYSDQDVVLG